NDRSTTKMPSLKEMVRLDAERAAPAWLRILVETVFFNECPEHPDASRATRSGGCNFFCVDCAGPALCCSCIEGEHDGHQIIQIRKSSRHSVVKVKDLESLLGVGEVQTYPQNNDLVVFLNKRPMEGRKPGEYRCKNCDRALLNKEYRFCSLGCKRACLEDDFTVSFAVPKGETKSSEDGAAGISTPLSKPPADTPATWDTATSVQEIRDGV
ncbi:hypothetical protein EJB05_30724, partial [Eragrostis curvula]